MGANAVEVRVGAAAVVVIVAEAEEVSVAADAEASVDVVAAVDAGEEDAAAEGVLSALRNMVAAE